MAFPSRYHGFQRARFNSTFRKSETHMRRRVFLLGCLILLAVLPGCDRNSAPSGTSASSTQSTSNLVIWSGSENRSLDFLIQEFAARGKVSIQVNYVGSVDISRQLQNGKQAVPDALWPAASLWLGLG